MTRKLVIGDRSFSEKVRSSRPDLPAERDFFVSYLANRLEVGAPESLKRLNYIDLFCGGGGLSLGIQQAGRFLDYQPKLVAAVDIDDVALGLVRRHFSPMIARAKSVEDVVRYEADLSGQIPDFLVAPVINDTQIAQLRGKVDLLVGGPPCQGHSNLNNRTRRSDPRNLLYLVMPAVAIALKIPNLIIENVRSIAQAREDVLGIAKKILITHGYDVKEAVLNAADYGTAQTRTRHFLVASKSVSPRLGEMAAAFSVPHLTFDEVCGGLSPLNGMEDVEVTGSLSQDNIDRIDYLYDNNLLDLPNNIRPLCHQDEHSYPSVYGRLRGDLPSQTITTGFTSPGRGRYVHPHERRVLNVREAGRLQGFPDWYWRPAVEAGLKRSHYSKIVGDAVPSLFAYPLLAALLPS